MKAIQRRGEVAENVSLLKRAIEVDPKFAMAYSLLGRTYSDLGESELGAQNSSKAYELRDRVSDRENFFITYNYYRQVQRNLEMTRQTAESWAREYPGDDMPHSFLSGLTSMGTGHYEKAAEESERTIELNPNFTLAYENAAFAYVYLNRLSQAETVLRKASELKMEVLEFSILRYFIAFLRSDQAAMEREVTQRQAKMEAQGWFQHQEA
jgi:tetratricopeptide (TPR) repeat protein